MSRILIFSTALLGLAGCVSNSDFSASQAQVRQLTTKLTAIENDVSSLKSELALVKNQRLIRLPTGAPTVTEARKRKSVNMGSEEDVAYNSAIQLYKSGDILASIRAFEQFNSRYPNSKHQSSVLYYIGQASYTQREYYRAQQVLEELVYQNPAEKIDSRSPELLKKVYQAQGLNNKVSELDSFMTNMSNHSDPTSAVPVIIPSETPPLSYPYN